MPDPSERLVAVFDAVYTSRMQGLPFVNPALRVEAIAFEPWKHYWLGVLLTPWSMNLQPSLCRHLASWRPLAQGEKRRYTFPAGAFDFISASAEDFGEYLMCSLFSPVLELADQDTARQVATMARAALFDPANAETANPAGASQARRRQRTQHRDGSRNSKQASRLPCRVAICCTATSWRPTKPMRLCENWTCMGKPGGRLLNDHRRRVVVRMAWDGQRVSRVNIESTRPFSASRIFIGRKPEEVVAIVPRLFSICGDAQTAAAASALTAAGAEMRNATNAIDVTFEDGFRSISAIADRLADVDGISGQLCLCRCRAAIDHAA